MPEIQTHAKLKRIAMLAFIVLAAALFVYFMLFRFDAVSSGVSTFFAILAPIIYGFILAYILNPVMRFTENCCLKIWAKCKKTPSTKALKALRVSSSILSVILLLLIVGALFTLLMPQLKESVHTLIGKLPQYSDNLQNWYTSFINTYAVDEPFKSILSSTVATIQDWISVSLPEHIKSFAPKLTSSVVDIFGFLMNLLLGLVVAIYVMVAQDSIGARAKRMCYAFFNIATANQILKNLRFIDEKFGGFFIGKIIDSAIIGVMCYVGCLFIFPDYALLIAVIIGVTNVIPFFGPFVGAIPTTFLILCNDPLAAVVFIIFVFLLQQFDGNFLGPKILGDSVGVSSFMVLVAILIGGGFLGFPGMIIGVPLCAILTSVIQAQILQRIADKNLPGDIADYQNMEKMDPWTRKVLPKTQTAETPSFYTRISQRSPDIADFYVKLKNNPWDRTAEDVEQERLQFKAEWETDRKYCQTYAKKMKDSKSNTEEYSDDTKHVKENSQTVSDSIEPTNLTKPAENTKTHPKTSESQKQKNKKA